MFKAFQYGLVKKADLSLILVSFLQAIGGSARNVIYVYSLVVFSSTAWLIGK